MRKRANLLLYHDARYDHAPVGVLDEGKTAYVVAQRDPT